MSMYTILHLGQALAKNIQTLLICRFLGGFFAVAPLVNAGGGYRLVPCLNHGFDYVSGAIADIWDAEKRGTAVSLFAASVFIGPGTSFANLVFMQLSIYRAVNSRWPTRCWLVGSVRSGVGSLLTSGL
jgi:hypothetical protein